MAKQTADDRYARVLAGADRSHALMEKWKAERNLWISSFALTLFV